MDPDPSPAPTAPDPQIADHDRPACAAEAAVTLPRPDLPEHRRPESVLTQLRARHGRDTAVWVFGYASLIWRPEFDAEEHRPASIRGWHRCLRMRSRVNRGTPEQPGLVFALMSGGACRGFVYRLPTRDIEGQLQRLWAREMAIGVYDPRWLPAQTPGGIVPALAFTLSRRSPAWTGPLPDEELLHILRHARGRYGTTLDYLLQTSQALRRHGVHDRAIERMVRLAQRHGLCEATER